jgi:hypothetical protein
VWTTEFTVAVRGGDLAVPRHPVALEFESPTATFPTRMRRSVHCGTTMSVPVPSSRSPRDPDLVQDATRIDRTPGPEQISTRGERAG